MRVQGNSRATHSIQLQMDVQNVHRFIGGLHYLFFIYDVIRDFFYAQEVQAINLAESMNYCILRELEV